MRSTSSPVTLATMRGTGNAGSVLVFDDRIYHAWWGEKIFGLRDEYDYDSHANVSLAANLKGKLFLVHGEMDDNVTPHHTMRLVDAYVSALADPIEGIVIP